MARATQGVKPGARGPLAASVATAGAMLDFSSEGRGVASSRRRVTEWEQEHRPVVRWARRRERGARWWFESWLDEKLLPRAGGFTGFPTRAQNCARHRPGPKRPSAAAGCVVVSDFLAFSARHRAQLLLAAGARNPLRWQRMNASTETRPKPARLAACNTRSTRGARLTRVQGQPALLAANLSSSSA